MGVNYRNVYTQDAEPTPEHVGDLWITDLGVVKVCYRTTLQGGANLWVNPVAYDPTLQALTSGQVFVGSGTNLAAAVAISGDATLSSAGALTNLNETVQVWNGTGSPITTDKVVTLLGFDVTSGLPKIVLADADVATHDDLWVTTATIGDAAAGTVKKRALSAANLNTNSATTAGDPVYLSTTAGGFAHTPPTTAISRNHPVGWVVVKSATVGQIRWAIGRTRMIGTNELQLLAVTGSLVAAATLDGTKAAVVAASNLTAGLPVMHRLTHADHATETLTYTLVGKIQILDAWIIKGAAGHATEDTVILKNGATAITDTLALGATANALKRFASIDLDQSTIAAGADLTAVWTKGASGGNNTAATLMLLGIPVA